jgi:hypothetical protein
MAPLLESLDARIVPSTAHVAHAEAVALRTELKEVRLEKRLEKLEAQETALVKEITAVTTQIATATTNAATPATTVTNPATPANMGQQLGAIYQAFATFGVSGVAAANPGNRIIIVGSDVGISAHWNATGNFSAYVSALSGLGMQVTASSAPSGTVVGLLPIGELVAAADLSQTMSLTPNMRPNLSY